MSALFSLLLGVLSAGDLPSPVTKPAASAFKPFDLKYFTYTTPSIFAVRPGELLKHIGDENKANSEVIRRFLAAAFAFMDGDLKAATPPTLTDIEQVVVGARISMGVETQPDGRGAVKVDGVSTGIVKTTKPFDWTGSLKKWFPKAEVVKLAGREYRRMPIGIGEKTPYLALFVADNRTLVFDMDEEGIKGLLRRLNKGMEPPTLAGWDEVSHDMAALWHDTTAEGWLFSPMRPKREADRALVSAVRGMTALAIGLSAGDKTTLRIVATSRDEDDARDVRTALRVVVTHLTSDDIEPTAAKFFAGTTVKRDGSVVRMKGSAQGDLLRRLLDPDSLR